MINYSQNHATRDTSQIYRHMLPDLLVLVLVHVLWSGCTRLGVIHRVALGTSLHLLLAFSQLISVIFGMNVIRKQLPYVGLH